MGGGEDLTTIGRPFVPVGKDDMIRLEFYSLHLFCKFCGRLNENILKQILSWEQKGAYRKICSRYYVCQECREIRKSMTEWVFYYPYVGEEGFICRCLRWFGHHILRIKESP